MKLLNWLKRWQIEFKLDRFTEWVEYPVKSYWSIRILLPSKDIRACKVTLDGKPLPFWDSDLLYYERSIPSYTGAIVRVPEELRVKVEDNYKVEIWDGNKLLKSVLFNEIPITKP
ncbi:MAG: hypothetical protein KIH08_15790 [Candidatus Freyarchaeota archaeon]|nr:hypothetical protein [Candidatus Jordarchaeia archaeon]